jgi:hypothetical protein
VDLQKDVRTIFDMVGRSKELHMTGPSKIYIGGVGNIWGCLKRDGGAMTGSTRFKIGMLAVRLQPAGIF